MSDVSTFTPRFRSAPRHVLALHAREQAIERILPAEAIASPRFPGVAEGAKRGRSGHIYMLRGREPGGLFFLLPPVGSALPRLHRTGYEPRRDHFPAAAGDEGARRWLAMQANRMLAKSTIEIEPTKERRK